MADTTRRYLRQRKGTDQWDALEVTPAGSLASTVRTPKAYELQKISGFSILPEDEYQRVLNEVEARKGPALPEGRTPFFLGDKAEHPAKPAPAKDPLYDTLTWAARMGRFPGEPEPEVDVQVGAPAVLSRTPEPAPKPASRRPALSVSAAGQVSRAEEQRFLDNTRRGPLQVPAALQSVYEVDPEVGQYLAAQLGDELGAAQGQSRDALLAARLVHAGAMANTAISGARHEEGAYQGLEEGARQPVADVLERRKAAMQQADEQRAVEELGLRREDMARRGAADERDFRFRSEQATREDELARLRLEQDDRQHMESLRARAQDRAMQREEMRWRMSQSEGDRRAQAEGKRQDMLERQNEKDLAELAKRSQPASEMRDDIETVRGFVAKGGRNWDALPGVGPVEGLMPEWLRTHDGDRLFQAANRLAANVILAKSGKAATDSERKTLLANYGIRAGMTEDAFVSGMEALSRDAQGSLQNIEAGFTKEVVDQRRARGGTTSAELPQGSVPVATGRMRRSKTSGRWEVQLSDGRWVPR